MTSAEEQKKLKVAKVWCEHDLLFFTRYFFKAQTGHKFIVAGLHEQIRDVLMRVVRGEIRNLIINIPPRYGKTEIAVIKFIAWCIALNPAAKFIHLSYSDDLALDNSSKIKELIESDEFQRFWPVKLKQDSKSKKKWYTEAGGGLYATAAGGPLTGFGAGSTVDDGKFHGAIVIDDPHKVDDAASELERKKVTARLNSTIKSRRNSRNTPIIIIMQRLHEEDMTGFAMAGGMGEEFSQLTLRALREDGTALWDFKHTGDELRQMQRTDPYGFSGQYQQEPSPEDGEFFKREWLSYYDELPKHLRMYGASDYAVTADGGDYTVHLVAGVDPNDDIYLADLWRGRTDSLEWVEVLLDLIVRHKPLEWAEEGGQIRRSLDPLITKRQAERKAFCYRKQFTSATDKPTRAQAIRGRMAQRKVYLPKHAAWAEPLIRELLQFPNGKHDDQVDALSLLGRMLAEMVAADKPKESKPWEVPPPPTLNQMLEDHIRRKRREDD